MYPKLVILFETTRSEAQIRAALDGFIPQAKQRIRDLVDTDPQTSIVSWHYHLSTGRVDEVEP